MSGYRIASLAIAVAALAIVAVVALSKGGGKSKHRERKAVPRATGGPQPRETLAQFERRLSASIASPSCQGYRALIRNIPPSCAEVKRRFSGVRYLGEEQYGTGAVIDATAPVRPKGITFALALAADRRWKILDTYGTEERTIETKAKDQIPFDEAADGWLQAVRTSNCGQYVQYAQFRVEGATSQQQACDAEFGDPAVAPDALRSDASAQLESLGGNAQFQFYAVRFRPSHYGTIAATYFPGHKGEDHASVAQPLYLN